MSWLEVGLFGSVFYYQFREWLDVLFKVGLEYFRDRSVSRNVSV